ncbi:MAG TPA: response regulator [Burkholderiaceae bacterium]|nr:response regulator [Burkholderiaceae bacterium]
MLPAVLLVSIAAIWFLLKRGKRPESHGDEGTTAAQRLRDIEDRAAAEVARVRARRKTTEETGRPLDVSTFGSAEEEQAMPGAASAASDAEGFAAASDAEGFAAAKRAAEKAALAEAQRLADEAEQARRAVEEAARAQAQRIAAAEEAERLEAQRLEAQRLEAERLEAERLEAQRLEAQRLEAQRLEAQRLEAQRLEAQRLEAQRLEAEAKRLEAKRLKAERLEAQRIAAEEARLAAEYRAAEEEAQREFKRLAEEKKARLEAEQRAAEEEARREIERLAAQEKARQEQERLAAENAATEAEARREADAPTPQAATHDNTAAEVVARPAPREQAIILIADDSKLVRVKTGRLLQQHGYQIVNAEDGLAGAQRVDEDLPDLIITDVDMPGLDGFELTARVRGNPRTAHIPVIMITAADERHRAHAERVGVSAVLGKPYADEQLLAHIEAMLLEAVGTTA